MVTEHFDVILVTADSSLRQSAQQGCPRGARLLSLTAEEFRNSRGRTFDALWVDLDDAPDIVVPAGGEHVYFYSSPPAATHALPHGEFYRKPCGAEVFAVLWAARQAFCRGDRQEPPPQLLRVPLPGWVLEFQRLELRELCQRCIRSLPQRLGYLEVALYLFDSERSLLTLAESNFASAIDLSVRVEDASRHVLAAVARERSVLMCHDLQQLCAQRELICPADLGEAGPAASLIAALPAGAGLAGVLWLRGRSPHAAEAELTEGLRAFLGQALDQARRFERAQLEARLDVLTGLFNYRWMRETLEREIRRTERFGAKLSLMLVDLDNFKRINDLHGHAAGDAVLRHAAARIRAALRQVDSAARLGGDEFAVLLPETELDGAGHVAARVVQAVRDNVAVYRDRPLPITASIGLAQWQAGWDVQALLDAADRAMYAAKRGGRNCVRVAEAWDAGCAPASE